LKGESGFYSPSPEVMLDHMHALIREPVRGPCNNGKEECSHEEHHDKGLCRPAVQMQHHLYLDGVDCWRETETGGIAGPVTDSDTVSTETTCLGSFDTTDAVFISLPDLPPVSTVRRITPFSPGWRRPELAITAAQPQEVEIFWMMSSSSPLFLNSKACSTLSPALCVPSSATVSVNSIEGAASTIDGTAQSRTAISTFFMLPL